MTRTASCGSSSPARSTGVCAAMWSPCRTGWTGSTAGRMRSTAGWCSWPPGAASCPAVQRNSPTARRSCADGSEELADQAEGGFGAGADRGPRSSAPRWPRTLAAPVGAEHAHRQRRRPPSVPGSRRSSCRWRCSSARSSSGCCSSPCSPGRSCSGLGALRVVLASYWPALLIVALPGRGDVPGGALRGRVAGQVPAGHGGVPAVDRCDVPGDHPGVQRTVRGGGGQGGDAGLPDAAAGVGRWHLSGRDDRQAVPDPAPVRPDDLRRQRVTADHRRRCGLPVVDRDRGAGRTAGGGAGREFLGGAPGPAVHDGDG